jgi:HK97 family phage portal protein
MRSTAMQMTKQEESFLEWLGVSKNGTASEINESTYFTCLKLLSEGIARVPLYLYKETEDGPERAKDHPLYKTLSLRPNPYMSAIDFWRSIVICRYHYGYGSAYIKRIDKKIELYPVKIENIIIDNVGLINSKLNNPVLVQFSDLTGNGSIYDARLDDIFIIKNFTIDGMTSKSNRQMISSTIKTSMKSQDYLNSLYDNGLTNKIAVQLTSDIREEKQLRQIQEKFKRVFSDNGRVFTVPAGYTIQSLNLSLADAQFEELKRMSISQIASSFGIKMYQLNDLSNTNNNSLEHQQLSFLVDTLLIVFESIEQETDYKLLTKDDYERGYYSRHNTNVILRTDSKTQSEIIKNYVGSSVYAPNEARRQLDRKDKEGGNDLIVNAGVLKLKDINKDKGGGEDGKK